MTEWQPIETFPKDWPRDVPVLLYFGEKISGINLYGVGPVSANKVTFAVGWHYRDGDGLLHWWTGLQVEYEDWCVEYPGPVDLKVAPLLWAKIEPPRMEQYPPE
jgi:hypothetical protein